MSDAKERALTRVTDPHVPAVGDPLLHYIEQVKRFEQLERDEETALARAVRDTGDADAARRLVSANLMLVVKLALMYRRALRNVMDLIQEGNVGLMEALKRYDPEQGVRFSTYAAWWIKAYMLKFLMDNARLVRVGTTNARRKLLYNLRREQRKLEAQGIAPTPRLLAERFGVPEEDVVDIDRALRSPDASIDAPLTPEGDFTVGDVLPAQVPSPEDQVVASDLKQRIDAAIASFREGLDDRERALLDGRLVSAEPLTLQELGDRYGVTREAMRQAEVKLKRRLASFLRQKLGDEVILQFTGGGGAGEGCRRRRRRAGGRSRLRPGPPLSCGGAGDDVGEERPAADRGRAFPPG
ncbi:MAG: sigma-70 family RNA polymerase sigma factor [Acidobacteria bacterium]|nr:sigma-70 family RNA polymerase sigma factor [Acidobacteriota bacterium]